MEQRKDFTNHPTTLRLNSQTKRALAISMAREAILSMPDQAEVSFFRCMLMQGACETNAAVLCTTHMKRTHILLKDHAVHTCTHEGTHK